MISHGGVNAHHHHDQEAAKYVAAAKGMLLQIKISIVLTEKIIERLKLSQFKTFWDKFDLTFNPFLYLSCTHMHNLVSYHIDIVVDWCCCCCCCCIKK